MCCILCKLESLQKTERKRLRKYLPNYYNLDYKDKYGDTGFILACRNNNIAIAKRLIESGVNLEAKNNYGDTGLTLAAMKQHIAMVKFLIKRGANVDAQNKEGDTCLIEACRKNHAEIVKFLIERGANLDAQNKQGYTCLIEACRKTHGLKFARILIQAGANVNAITEHGQTALIGAFERKDMNLMNFLIETGAEMDINNNKFQIVASKQMLDILINFYTKQRAKQLHWMHASPLLSVFNTHGVFMELPKPKNKRYRESYRQLQRRIEIHKKRIMQKYQNLKEDLKTIWMDVEMLVLDTICEYLFEYDTKNLDRVVQEIESILS
jgi:hypothetical protein